MIWLFFGCLTSFWHMWRHFRSGNRPQVLNGHKAHLPKPYLDWKPNICIISCLSLKIFTEKFRKRTRENLFLTLILKRGTLTPSFCPKSYFKLSKTHIAAQISTIRIGWCMNNTINMANLAIFCREKWVLATLGCPAPLWRTWHHFRSMKRPKNVM